MLVNAGDYEAAQSTLTALATISTENNWLTLSPNPISGAVEVRWNPGAGTGILEVFNMSGMLIMQQKVTLQDGLHRLTLDSQPIGMYVVRLRTAAGSLTRKLIIE